MERGRLLSWPVPPWIGHTGGVWCINYSPNGCYIVTGPQDKTIRIWDAETGSAIGELLEGHTQPVRSVAYSPDGRHIISGSEDTTIRIWDADNGSAVGKPLEGHFGWVRSVAYSPDGRHIFSGSSDKTIRIWDAEMDPQSASLWKGTMAGCGPLLTLLTGGKSSPESQTRQFEYGMPKLVLQSASL